MSRSPVAMVVARALIARALIAGALIAGACRAPRQDPAQARWRDDLDFLERELPARHLEPFFQLPEAEWHAGFAALRADLPRLTEPQILVRAMQLVARLGDGHTRLSEPPGGGFPVGLYWFDDGVHVTAASPAAAWAVGHAVTAIGGRPATEALALAATTAPHDNASQERSEAVAALVRPRTAAGLGLVDADGALVLTVAVDGGARELRVRRADPPAVPPPVDPATAPLARRGAGRRYWSQYLPDRRALFVQYNACAEGTPRFADFAAAVGQTLATEAVDRLIIDLRANSGGNSEVARPLLDLVARTPGLAARTFVLIGRATFSSAVLNALALADAGATLVGETAGGAPSHYGEVQVGVLPRTGFPFSYSTKHFVDPAHPGRELVPAIAVPVRASDYFGGVDAALDAALAAPVAAAGP